MYWNYPKKSKKNESYGDMIHILLNDTYTVNRHIELFEEMCSLYYTAVIMLLLALLIYTRKIEDIGYTN